MTGSRSWGSKALLPVWAGRDVSALWVLRAPHLEDLGPNPAGFPFTPHYEHCCFCSVAQEGTPALALSNFNAPHHHFWPPAVGIDTLHEERVGLGPKRMFEWCLFAGGHGHFKRTTFSIIDTKGAKLECLLTGHAIKHFSLSFSGENLPNATVMAIATDPLCMVWNPHTECPAGQPLSERLGKWGGTGEFRENGITMGWQVITNPAYEKGSIFEFKNKQENMHCVSFFFFLQSYFTVWASLLMNRHFF